MVSQNRRIDKLEDAHAALARVVSTHLEESGEIRTDLKWLKKFLWVVIGSPYLLELLKHIGK